MDTIHTHKKRQSMAFLGDLYNSSNGFNCTKPIVNKDKNESNKCHEEQKHRKKTQDIKQFIKNIKDKYKTKNELYESNKTYFDENKINFAELVKLYKEIEKEEKEEKIRKRKEIKEKEKTIKKEISLSLNQNKKSKLIISHNHEINFYPKSPKKFKKSILKLEGNLYKLNIFKTKNFNAISKLSHKTNEYFFISNKNEYLKNRSKSFIIKLSNKEEIINLKKMKYDLSELFISSNQIINTIIRTKNKVEDFAQNGIELNDLRINKKYINDNISKIENIEKIMRKIENENIMKRLTKAKNIPLNYMICINCYECFDIIEKDKHKEHFILKVEDFKIDDEILDCEEKLNIIYQNLKKIQKKIIKTGNKMIIQYYGKLIFSLYNIIINNNSKEELHLSLININKNFLYEMQKGNFSEIFKNLFLLFCQTISQLTYLKAKEISFSEFHEESQIRINELEDDSIFDEKIQNNNN